MSQDINLKLEITGRTVSAIHITQYSLCPKPPHCPQRPLVLLLHGWLGTHRDLCALATKLANDGYRVLVPDLPLHGQSTGARPSTLFSASQLLLQALTAFLESSSQKHHPLALVGYSLGGRVALELVISLCVQPSPAFQVHTLVLISSALPPAISTEYEAREAAGRRLAFVLKGVSPRKDGLRRWLTESWYAAPMWGGLLNADGFENMIERRLEGYDVDCRDAWADAAAKMSKYTLRAHSGPLVMRALYIHGNLDEKYARYASQISSLFAHSSVAGIPGTGHNVLVEKPGPTASHISRFLLSEYPVISCGQTVRINSVKVFKYSLPLRKTIVVNGQKVSRREGVLLALSSSAGARGVGDICPLPGLHTEDVESCVAEIKVFSENLKRQREGLCYQCFALDQLGLLTEGFSCVSRNGCTCAIMHLLSESGDADLFSFLKLHATREVPSLKLPPLSAVHVNGVLPRLDLGSEKKGEYSLETRVLRVLETCPFQVLKLKVGSVDNVDLDAKQVREAVRITKAFNRTLRLDANKAWSLEQYLNFQNSLGQAPANIEFTEEPFCTVGELESYLATASIDKLLPIGLDESLAECSLTDVKTMASSALCQALIVKPSVLGSLSYIFKLMSISSETNSRLVMSSVFDSGVGISWTAILAAVCSGQNTSHGLGTYEFLGKDVHQLHFKDFCVSKSLATISVPQCQEFMNIAALQVAREGSDLHMKIATSHGDGSNSSMLAFTE